MSKSTHYPLTADEFFRLNAELKDAELRVYLYLMVLNPFPNSVMEIDTSRIAEQLGLTRRTVQRAVKRLCELQLIEVEITKFKYKKAVHGASSRLGSSDIRIADGDTQIVSSDIRIADGDTRIVSSDIRIADGDTRIVSNDIRIADTPIKPLQDKDSSSPQINKINNNYSDFIDSLSKEERASFLKFCEQKTKNLSQPVNDIEAWLANTNKAGKNRWDVYYEKYLATKQAQVKKTETKSVLDEFHRELEERQRQAKKAWEESQAQKLAALNQERVEVGGTR